MNRSLTSRGRPRTRGKRTLGAAAAASLVAGLLAVGVTSTAQADEEAADALPLPRALNINAERVQSIPGQYQIAHSETTGKIYVTGSEGRPPVVTGTVAEIDPDTMEIDRVANLPIVPHPHSTTPGWKTQGALGIDIDDTRGHIWITSTRDEQMQVLDLETLEVIWTSYYDNLNDFDPEDSGTWRPDIEVHHPREVWVDEARGLAYVTSANRGGASQTDAISVYDVETFEIVERISIPDRSDYGDAAYPVTMGFAADESRGELYTSDFRTDQLYVIDLQTQSLKSTAQFDNPNGGAATLQSSSIAVNPDLGEIYTANQGDQSGGWAGLIVFDQDTLEEKYRIETGQRALAVDVDTENDVVYVADFADGTTTVVDARAQEVVAVLETPNNYDTDQQGGANHVIVANGDAFVVDKARYYDTSSSEQQPTYVVDYLTGERITSGTENKTGTESTLYADSLVKLSTPWGNERKGASRHVTKVENEFSVEAGAGDSVFISGSGFAPGQRLAIRINNDQWGIIGGDEGEGDERTVRERIAVDADGNFHNEEVPIPEGLQAGTHDIVLLDSAPVTNPRIPFTVHAAGEEGEEFSNVTETEVVAGGQPAGTMYTPTYVVAGEDITIRGEGFFPNAGEGNFSAGPVFLNQPGGAPPTNGPGVNVANREIENQVPDSTYADPRAHGVWLAEPDGTWEITIPFPTPENSSLTEATAWQAGDTHLIRVLSGSLGQNDLIRNPAANIEIVASEDDIPGGSEGTEPEPVPQPEFTFEPTDLAASELAFAGYPEVQQPDTNWIEAPEPSDPSDVTVNTGQSATFEITDLGTARAIPTTVQWQRHDGTDWVDVAGGTEATLELGAVDESHDGDQYRAVVSNLWGSTTTEAATLTVSDDVDPDVAPTVTEHPASVSADTGEDATFSAAAEGTPEPTVQWQRLDDGDWIDVAGATGTSLRIESATDSDDGAQYRAVFTNAAGSATSDPATLTVRSDDDDDDDDGSTDPDGDDLTDDNRGTIEAPDEAERGETITVRGAGEHAGDDVRVWLLSTPADLGSSAVAADGTFSATIPTDAELGPHRIAVYTADGDLIGWDDITVVESADGGGDSDGDGSDGSGSGAGDDADGTGGSSTTGGGGWLPSTGAEMGLWLLVAALLAVVSGTGLLIARRRMNSMQ